MNKQSENEQLLERKIKLLLAIDRIRDQIKEPDKLYGVLVNLLTDQFQTDLCLLGVVDKGSGGLRLKALSERQASQFRLTDQFEGMLKKITEIVVWNKKEADSFVQLKGWSEQASLAVVPIRLQNNLLGVLILGRQERPFTLIEQNLLQLVESQVDSAIMQAYDYYELAARHRELATIYRIDQIRDERRPFDEMLQAVIEELQKGIQAEISFILLYDAQGQQLELRAISRATLVENKVSSGMIYQAAQEAIEQKKLVCHNDLPGEIHSVITVPLILHQEYIGVLGVANRIGQSWFEAEDLQILRAIGSQIDTAIFESLQQRHLRQLLGRAVDPQVMERLLATPDEFLQGERAVVTVLYADIRGSTALAEKISPDLLVGFINDYLGSMTEVVLREKGTLDKFVGDEVMALFGAPFAQEDHALRSIRVGLAMQEAHQEVMARWKERGVEESPIGIGVATGELIVGEIGCAQRTDYTVIGNAANLGARICSAAKGGELLICPETYRLVADQVVAEPIEGLSFKGVSAGLTVYRIKQLVD